MRCSVRRLGSPCAPAVVTANVQIRSTALERRVIVICFFDPDFVLLITSQASVAAEAEYAKAAEDHKLLRVTAASEIDILIFARRTTLVDPPLGEMLNIHFLTKRFGDYWALRGASFSIRSGEVLGIVGPNGSGKTTLLECLAGLLPADGGHVRGDEPLVPRKRRDVLFYMPDGILPWPQQTVGWTLRFSAALQGVTQEDVEEVEMALGLGPTASQRVATLSKGQRKRLLIALALLTPQPLILLDEPFDGLDLRAVRDIGPWFRSVAMTGRTMLLAIHQLHDAARVCDRLVLLNEGRVAGEGTLDELRLRAGLPHGDLEEVFLALT